MQASFLAETIVERVAAELGLDARFALVEALQQGRAREALRALTELTGGPVLLPTE